MITTESIQSVIIRLNQVMEQSADELNSADGLLGDGDLGVTMIRGFRHLLEELESLPEDIGMAFFQCAKAFTKSSGSSYGTLLATGMMAVAKGIGATRVGVFESSFIEEAELDLFAEQVIWPGLVAWFEECFKLGVKEGFSAELMVLELYGSGEASEILRLMSEKGFYKQMANHSTTSQYGTLSRSKNLLSNEQKTLMRERLIHDIKGGEFVKEWSKEQASGSKNLEKLKA